MPDKKLFTPGPLNCSLTTKEAMLTDLGSRDLQFIQTIKEIRSELVKIADVDPEEWTAVLLQGSGTYSVEAVIQTTTPREGGRILVLVNGAYGRRIIDMCRVAGIACDSVTAPETEPFNLEEVEASLNSGVQYSTVAIVHCETSTGVLNNVAEVSALVRKYQPTAAMFVDAMSSFGAIPLELKNVDYVVSSANKCLQGVPGFAYVICRKDSLWKCKGNSRCLSFDLVAQEENMLKTGQFRFTPPTHTLLAFRQALAEFTAEGGLKARNARYKNNSMILNKGMKALGFRSLVPAEFASPIITCFLYPAHPNFSFTKFYNSLSDKGQIIYPGKVTTADCFRLGNIGDLHAQDMETLLVCVKEVSDALNIPVPVTCDEV